MNTLYWNLGHRPRPKHWLIHTHTYTLDGFVDPTLKLGPRFHLGGAWCSVRMGLDPEIGPCSIGDGGAQKQAQPSP